MKQTLVVLVLNSGFLLTELFRVCLAEEANWQCLESLVDGLNCKQMRPKSGFIAIKRRCSSVRGCSLAHFFVAVLPQVPAASHG